MFVSHYPEDDVLSAHLDGATIRRAREADHDGYLILQLDGEGRVVGVEALFATQLLPRTWASHPDREALPQALREAIDDFVRTLTSRVSR